MAMRFAAFLAEATGTAALVFFGTGAIIVNAQTGQIGHGGIAAAFGLVIMVMIAAFGHVSGAQFNPAVTIGLASGGHLPWASVPGYLGAQLAGAIGGSAAAEAVFGGDARLGMTLPAGTQAQSLALEAIMTMALLMVITAVATDPRATAAPAAIVIGGTIALCALVGGPISGASMNPARSLGPAIVAGDLTAQWLYLAGPLVGAVAGVWLMRQTRPPRTEA